jgi:two-component system nitrate/nitrite response regulator NarL
MKTIKLVIVEDHQSMIDGIKLLLKHEPEINVLGFFKNGLEFLEFLKEFENPIPDVVLTDVKMPSMNGYELAETLQRTYPHIRVIAFSMLTKESIVLQMLQAGVSGYLIKNSSLDLILEAVKSVAEGNVFFNPSLYDIVHRYQRSPKKIRLENVQLLTKSEREILKLIAEGKISSEIADIRFTAVSTIEKHRKNMIRKLGLTGKNDLLKYAVEKKYEGLL